MSSTTLIISTILLWLAVIGLGVLILSLARQVGILHERISPAGALMIAGQLEVGTRSPMYDLEALDGSQISIGKPREDDRRTLLYFLSPTCPICSSLLTVVRDIDERDPALEVVLMSDGPREDHEKYRARKQKEIGNYPYILSEEVGRAFGVGKLPYAVLIDSAGVVRAHGLVNTREHLESLFEAEAQGLASIQDYVQQEAEKAEQSADETETKGETAHA